MKLITKTRKDESTKGRSMRGEVYLKEVSVELTEMGKEKHQFEELSKKIIGAAIQVHRELGPGFLENIYEEALKVELSEHGFHFDCQTKLFEAYVRGKKSCQLNFVLSYFRTLRLFALRRGVISLLSKRSNNE